ncbi:MAG: thrombospondin type 3 repeat-containing protein, partial [Bermanella sp.]
IGNHTDTDDDGDGVADTDDAFPLDASEWLDTDGDGIGNNADTDDDGDGIGDNLDAFPLDPAEWLDTDGDGIGNHLDADDDGDLVLDINDAFPLDASEWLDTDGDGIGNNLDTDDDNDGVLDINDAFPLDDSEWLDTDGDGIGNNADTDDDNDGIPDVDDANPLHPDPLPGDEIASQDWQGFYTGADWFLTDFGLFLDSDRSDYVVGDEIRFDISWTKRTRNHMADLMGFEREDMSRDFANALCTPQIEVGKASVYGVGDASNMVAELDSDLSHCIVDGDAAATLRIRSFIPTKVGYHYRATVKYRMREYENMPHNAYRHLVMRFGKSKVHYEPVFDAFHHATIEILATRTYSKLTLKDNGIPDGYGIIIDDISVTELAQSELYDDCIGLFAQNSKGFRQCLLGEIDSDQTCTMNNFVFDYDAKGTIEDARQVVANALLQEEALAGTVNFLSLGKKGKLSASCYIGEFLAAFPIYNQQLFLREIAWGDENVENYPEQAHISVHLSHCDDDRVNGKNHLGLVSTGESFGYDFTANEDSVSYAGCRLKKLEVEDKTPKNSPSTDGFDLNSLEFRGL